jgi:threonine aldolase
MIIDLRSDTVTKPTPGMLQAMQNAKVGDDVFGEDPTIHELEEKAAAIFGHEAGLFCPSGTMTNQIAISVHTRPGDEVICSDVAHIYMYEGGGIARNSGASVKLLHGDRGRFNAAQVEAVINPGDDYYARTSLVSVEDTCNRGGGSVYEFDELQEIGALCKSKGLAYHNDGARVFNALQFSGYNPLAYGQLFDSISICLSKGLGAPVGSVLVGNKDFIKQARRVRKVFGGGMRQGGYLAAAGIYAIDHHVKRLAEDHNNAAEIAETLKQCGFVKSVMPAETNILVFELNHVSRAEFIATLKTKGVLVLPFGQNGIRMVFHFDIFPEMIQQLQRVLLSS